MIAFSSPSDDAFRAEMLAQLPKLRAYAQALTRSSAESEDLVQDAVVRIWRFRARYQAGTNLGGWMVRILKNEFLSQRSRRRRQPAADTELEASQLVCGPGQEWRLQYQEMLAALETLPADNRDALLLVAADGLSYEEAAEACGCDVGVLKGRVHRARVKLAHLAQTSPAARRSAATLTS